MHWLVKLLTYNLNDEHGKEKVKARGTKRGEDWSLVCDACGQLICTPHPEQHQEAQSIAIDHAFATGHVVYLFRNGDPYQSI